MVLIAISSHAVADFAHIRQSHQLHLRLTRLEPVRLRYGLFTGFKELQQILSPVLLSFRLPDEWQIICAGFTPACMSYASWRTG